MPYVQRNENGEISGTFANPQPGFAEEYLPDDDPEVVAFNDAIDNPPPPPPTVEQQVLYDHENRIRAMEGQPPLDSRRIFWSRRAAMPEAFKGWFQRNQVLLIALLGQAVIAGIYMVNLEARVRTLEVRGSPHLAEINTRLTVLEGATSDNKARLDKMAEMVTRNLTINPA